MGFFNNLFEKKVCDICGGEIGLLGNRKLDDGNLCKTCASKLSPWFEDRRHSTVEEVRNQLEYREANKEKVRAFQITREFAGDSYHVFLDETKGQFAVAYRLSEENNPDIVNLSQVTGCRLEIREDRNEEEYKDQDGTMKSYVPPRYTYSYDYSIKLSVNSPWFDDMDFKLNNFSIEDHERGKMMEMEQLGNQIVAALTGIAGQCRNVWESGNAAKCGHVWESGNAAKCGHVWESGNAAKCGHVWEFRNAAKCGHVWESGNAAKCGHVWESGNAAKCRHVWESGNAAKCGRVWESRNAAKCGHVWESGNAVSYGDVRKCRSTKMQQLWMGAADTGENFKILPGVWKPVEYGIKIRESVMRQTLFTTLNDKILSNS